MTEKTWIKVHTGLTNDPKHRQLLGIRIWLFMWLIDHADYESGIVRDYTDKKVAQETKIPFSTVRKQRTDLQEMGYITCHPGFQCQHIRIMRWRNPRLVLAEAINLPDDRDTWYPLVGTPSPVGTHPPIEMGTLTIDPQNPTILPEAKPLTAWQEQVKAMAEGISDLTGDNLAVQETKRRVGQISAQLIKAGYTVEDVKTFGIDWTANDWRGQKGQRPTRNQVLSELPRVIAVKRAERTQAAAAMLENDGQVFDDYERMFGDQH